MRYLKLAVYALLAMTSFFTLNANAEIILTDPVSKTYQQTSNSPCIFGGPSCQNPNGFSYTSLPNSNLSQNYTLSSPDYTVGQIIDLVGNTFLVGIDINTTDKPATERIASFLTNLSKGRLPADSYIRKTPYQFLGEDNGTGWADATLGIFDLTGISRDATIWFDLSMLNTTDGVETFFLIRADGGSDNNVPEPGTIAIIGLGLLGISFAAKRGRGKQA